MATRRGLCLHCTSKRIDHRIFQVNPEASTCFCPLCMKEMEPKEAIENYNNLIKDMLLKADNTLFVACDPTLAYQQYADTLEFEPNEAHALIGRILCLIYMGKVRKSFLKEAYILLENTSYKGCDLTTFVNFLEKINVALDEYETAVNKKLTFREHYYDVECLKLYWTHLHDIIKMKELILSIFKSLKKNYVSQQNDVFINMLENNIEEKKKILALECHTTDGKGYKIAKFVDDKATIIETDSTASNKFIRFRLSTLNPDEKGKRVIKDEVFKDYTTIIKLRKASIFLWIFLYLCTAACIVGAILLMKNQLFFITFIALAVLFFLGGSGVLASSIYWRIVLKKRELRID